MGHKSTFVHSQEISERPVQWRGPGTCGSCCPVLSELPWVRSFVGYTLSLMYHTQVPLETRQEKKEQCLVCVTYLGSQCWLYKTGLENSNQNARELKKLPKTTESSDLFKTELSLPQGRENRRANKQTNKHPKAPRTNL